MVAGPPGHSGSASGRQALRVQYHARRYGKGPRQVLAIHCTLAHSGAWRGLSEQMRDEVTLHCPDMLCHGRSPDWDGQGDFHDKMIAAVLQHMSQPMDVIGHSFGASLALRLAVEHPDLVRSLTMIESVHFGVIRDEHPQMLADQNTASAPFRDAIDAGDFELGARLFNRGWGDVRGPQWDQMPESTRAAMTRGVRIVPASSPALVDDRPGILKPGVLERVGMPVLLMRGDQTEQIIGTVNETFARRLPDATNVVVNGAGHMLPISHPAETAGHLRDLFGRVGS